MDLKEEDLLKRNVKGISEKLKKGKSLYFRLGWLGLKCSYSTCKIRYRLFKIS